MKNLLLFVLFTIVTNVTTGQYTALRVANYTNCDYYLGIEMTDINHPACSTLFTTFNNIQVVAGSGSVIYSNVDLDNMGYAYSGTAPYWDSDPVGLNTQVRRVKILYDSGLTGCVDAVVFGPCPGNGNGPFDFNIPCNCNGIDPPNVTMSTIVNSPYNYTLITINP